MSRSGQPNADASMCTCSYRSLTAFAEFGQREGQRVEMQHYLTAAGWALSRHRPVQTGGQGIHGPADPAGHGRRDDLRGHAALPEAQLGI